MTTIAYIANEFPSSLEPYVTDEIVELRRRGAQVVCCSGKRVSPDDLTPPERAFWAETRFFQPLSDAELLGALRRLASNRHNLSQLLRPLLLERGVSPIRRMRTLGHSVMGAYHGEWGFQALSHRKAVLAKTTKPDLKLLYPPYTDRALKILRRVLG